MPRALSDQTKVTVIGAAPEGAHDPASTSRAVREMFTSIAPRYDLLNHLLSFNVDRLWWRKTARSFASILKRQDASVLDLCCGTGDMTLALFRQAGEVDCENPGSGFFARHAAAGEPEIGRKAAALGGGGCASTAFSGRAVRFDHHSIWLP